MLRVHILLQPDATSSDKHCPVRQLSILRLQAVGDSSSMMVSAATAAPAARAACCARASLSACKA